MYKIMGSDGKEYGPVTVAQVRQWVAEGRASAGTNVRAEGSNDWKPLAAFPEFGVTAGPSPAVVLPPGFTGEPRTSGLAISSLVLGILGFFTCGITGLVGLVLGIVALGKIRKSNGGLSGSGMAIAGICISACFLLLLPLMAALMLPALAKAKEKAMTVRCMNNLRQLDQNLRMYADANSGQLPAPDKWSDAISSTVGYTETFKCPADPAHRSSYAFNRALAGKKLDEVNPRTVLLFESNADWNGAGGASAIASHKHYGSSREEQFMVAHADGSVEAVPRSRLNSLRWDP